VGALSLVTSIWALVCIRTLPWRTFWTSPVQHRLCAYFYAPLSAKFRALVLIKRHQALTGVTIKVGSLTHDDYFYTGTSTVNKAIGDVVALTPLLTVVPAGTLVTCANAGSKVGTGNVVIAIEYTITDE
jgi:hypothetical protein